MPDPEPGAATAATAGRAGAAAEHPVLPDRAREDTDEGWDAEPDRDPQAAHDEWLRRQRPPHH